ncbi:hypothetical protein MRX96_002994 [Rhipicephalus microplus]
MCDDILLTLMQSDAPPRRCPFGTGDSNDWTTINPAKTAALSAVDDFPKLADFTDNTNVISLTSATNEVRKSQNVEEQGDGADPEDDTECASKGPEIVHATQAMAAIEEISPNEHDDLRAAIKEGTSECLTSRRDVAEVVVEVDAVCGDTVRPGSAVARETRKL